MKHKSTKKVPQIIIATLLSGIPICYAQSALATSSFGLPLDSQLHSQQQAISIQQLNQPKNYLSSRLRTSLTPSIEDLNTLKSTLSSHKAQLDTLIKQQPTNDSPQLQTAISRLQNSVQVLESNITDVEKALTAYNQAKDTLTNALKTQTLAQRDAEDKRKIYNSSLTSHEATKQQLAAQKTAQALAQAQLVEATQKAQEAQELLTNLTAALTQQQEASAQALQTLNERQANAITAQATLTQAQQALSNAQAQKAQAERNLSSKTSNEAQTKRDLAAAAVKLQTKQLEVDAARLTYNQAIAHYNQTLDNYTVAYNEYLAAQTTQNQAQTNLIQSQNALTEAQQNYDTLLIPDPTWTAPTYQKENTRLVPYTELQEVRTLVPRTTYITQGGVLAEVFNRQGYNNAPPLPTSNEAPIYTTTVSEINFNWGSGQVLNSGRSEDVIVRFTGNILVPTDGYYQFYAPADDGTQLTIAGMGITSDWYDKGGGGTISEPVFIRAGILYPFTLHYYENGGGATVGLFTYSPQQGFSVLPSTWLGTSVREETTYEEVITYEEVTKYREEIYYTTEPVLIEGTIQVKINEGGQATFTAPEGSTFTTSNLRYEAIGDPRCGININPPVQGQTQITISADNSVWGDPCGGYYKHVTGTISYLGQPSAPLINDPSLLPALQEAQANQQAALATFNEADQKWKLAQDNQQQAAQDSTAGYNLVIDTATSLNALSSDLDVEQNEFNQAQTIYDQANAELQQSQLELEQSQESLASSVQTSNEAEQSLITANSQLQTAEDLYSTESGKSQALQTSNEAAQRSLEAASGSKTQAQQELTTQEDLLATATSNEAQAKIQLDLSQADLTSADKTSTEASVSQQEAQEGTDNSATSFQSSLEVASATSSNIPDLIKEATEIYETPQGSPEVPTNLTAENLQEIDLSTIDPTELSPEQATLLVAAALETFETATEGSPEYEQALDALFLAAQQDDIVVDESLAAIPGVGEAAKAVVAIFNIVGNVGADISPEKRKEAQTLVVTTLVVGQIAQTAALASASSGGSFRRK